MSSVQPATGSHSRLQFSRMRLSHTAYAYIRTARMATYYSTVTLPNNSSGDGRHVHLRAAVAALHHVGIDPLRELDVVLPGEVCSRTGHIIHNPLAQC